MRGVVLALLLFFIAGCAQKKIYYTPHLILQNSSSKHLRIAVADVEVPEYLLQDTLLVKDAQEHFLPFYFIEDPRQSLTKALIQFLQTYFQEATVLHYPWQSSNSACKVRLIIDEVYIKQDTLFMHALVTLDQKQFQFFIHEPVSNLSQTFDKLLQKLFIKVAKAVDRSCQ